MLKPIFLFLGLALQAPVAAQTLPWPDAAPLPALPEPLARAVNPVVTVSRPGMDRVVYARDLAYTDRADPNIRMDIYQPPGGLVGPRRPAVLFIHGGADARARPKDWGIYQSWGRLVAASGFVAVVFNQSLAFPETRVTEGAADVASALAFVRANAARYGIDADRLCLIAFSAGGPLLAPYLRDAPPQIRCLVGYYPFMDIRQSSFHQQAESADTLRRHSNILRLDQPGRAVPLLLVRAGRDEIPTLLDSVDRFAAAALARNHPLTMVNHPEAPHGFDNQLGDAHTREIIETSLRFLADHLGVEGRPAG